MIDHELGQTRDYLEEIDASTRSRQSVLVVTSISNRELRNELLETTIPLVSAVMYRIYQQVHLQQRWPTTTSHKPQKCPPLSVTQPFHHLPERSDGFLLWVINPTIDRVFLQIIHIHRRIRSPEENLDLLLVEHLQPAGVDHLGEALEESVRLMSDLGVEAVMGYEVDVFEAVGASNRDGGAKGLEIDGVGHSKLCRRQVRMERKRRRVGTYLAQRW